MAVGTPMRMEEQPQSLPWGRASPNTARSDRDVCHHVGKMGLLGARGTSPSTSELFPAQFSNEELALDWSPPASRICSFAPVRTAGLSFCLLLLGNQQTPVLVFWLEEEII